MSFLPQISVPEWLLRIGVAGSFFYPPFDALIDPYSWIGYFPAFLTNLVAPHGVLLLHAFGVLEIGIALWLLLGRSIRIPALVASILLIAIVVCNLPQFQVLFRDVSIALAALALAFWPKQSTDS